MELVARFGELDKIWYREALLEQELRRLRYSGQIRLGGSLANLCIPTDCLVDRLPLGGQQRGFLQSSSISFSITHRPVILCLHLSSLHFYILVYYFVFLIMDLSSLFVLYARIYTIPHLELNQCKIYQFVTLIWGSLLITECSTTCIYHLINLHVVM